MDDAWWRRDEQRRYLPVAQCAEVLGVTEARVLQLAKAGALRWEWSPEGPLVEPAHLSGAVPPLGAA